MKRILTACVTLVLAAVMIPGLALADVLLDYNVSAVGNGIWRYDYYLGGDAFSEGQGFTIEFDEKLYSGLYTPDDSLTPGWDIILIQPSLTQPDTGYYDALWLEGDYTGSFSVEFTWLGQDTPGDQSFWLYQLDADGGILSESLRYGLTVPVNEFGTDPMNDPEPVPEPASGMLLLGGLLAGVALKLRKRSEGKVSL
jgi:hypothetical protein